MFKFLFVFLLQYWQVWVFSMLFAIAFAFADWLLQAAPTIEEPEMIKAQPPRQSNHANRFDLVLSDNKKRSVR